MNKFYTGIGSREVPPEEQHKCTIIAKHLSYADFTLRSGGSKGADTAFERGATTKEIYLPFKNFNKHPSAMYQQHDKAVQHVYQHHAVPHMLSETAIKLLGRNYHQLFGYTGTKSQFVVYYNVSNKGGTIYTVNLATYYGIPTYNTAQYSTQQLLDILYYTFIDTL